MRELSARKQLTECNHRLVRAWAVHIGLEDIKKRRRGTLALGVINAHTCTECKDSRRWGATTWIVQPHMNTVSTIPDKLGVFSCSSASVIATSQSQAQVQARNRQHQLFVRQSNKRHSNLQQSTSYLTMIINSTRRTTILWKRYPLRASSGGRVRRSPPFFW